ncbi:thiamine pyrophosphate-dependent enzyme [Sphingomonas flavalba]|uniref:thiamine pyrophosphate-dependent enzyme n=1 Tax=Sphingomonas flavalba TaxID=2559804 RepID=UPI0039E0B52F
MVKMKGGRAIVESVLRHGVDTIFGIPGGQTYELFDALYGRDNEVRLITSRSEQGAAYMAFGYARSTGKVGTFTVVPGPGVLNAGAALTTAYACNAPVLCLTGQVPSTGIGKGIGFLHDVPDQLGAVQRMTKWAARIDHPAHAPGAVAEAFRQLTTGRPGPVSLEMALDVMGQTAPVTLPEPEVPAEVLEPDPDLIAEAAALLGRAEKPLIFVGAGAIGAAEEVREIAEMLQAPVVSHRGGRGILSDRHYLSQTFPAGHRLWPEADVVLAIGTRLKYPRMHWGNDAALKVVHIDIDPMQLTRIAAPAVGLAGDAQATLRALIDGLGATNRRRDSEKDRLEALKAGLTKAFSDDIQPQIAYLDVLRGEMSDDAILVDEITQVGYASWYGFPVYAPRTLITSGYSGNLGYGLSTAVGVKIAHPERQVVSINGDGGFMYHCGELATVAKYNLDMVIIVFSDGAFTNVARAQTSRFGGRVVGTALQNPDFVKMAEAFGVAGRRAENPAELREALRAAFKAKGPMLIEVPIGETAFPWKYLLLPPVRGPKASAQPK